MIIRARLVVIAGILAACGGGGGGDSPGGGIDPRLARLDIYESQKTRVLGDPGAGVIGLAPTVSDLPDQGSASFAGFVTLRVEGAQGVVLFGDAALQVGFGNAQITGSMDRFFGTLPAGGVADYAGSISLTGGGLVPVFRLDYAGALTAPGQQLVIGGSMQGAFLGDPVRALSAADLEAQIMQNGQVRSGTFLVVMETAGVQQP